MLPGGHTPEEERSHRSPAECQNTADRLREAGKIWFASFDLSDDIAKAIKDGTIQFAIDQQPYLQGYIPVAVLATMKKEKTTDVKKVIAELGNNPKFKARLSEYGLEPVYGLRHISSGPGFVTKENLFKVQKYAGQYR